MILLNKVNDFLKNYANNDDVKIPNEDYMWNKILIKKEQIKTNKVKSTYFRKPNLMISMIVLTIFITATPVLAKYSSEIIDWLRITNRSGIVTSLENGFGQPINIVTNNRLGALEIQNIVTDHNGTNILFSLSIDNLETNNIVEFDRAIIEIDDKKKIDAEVVTSLKDKSNKLIGYIHTEEQIPANSKVAVKLGGIKELQLKEKEIREFEQLPFKLGNIPVEQNGISNIEIISSEYIGNQYQIDYRINFDESNKVEHARLKFRLDGELVTSFATGFKRPQVNVSHQRETLNIVEDKVYELVASLQYYHMVEYHPDLWSFSFDYDRDLAKRASYVIDVNKNVNFGREQYQFEKLVITPSKIKLHYEKKMIEQGNVQVINYNNIILQIGEQKLEGYNTIDGYFSFETNDIFKNIENEKMSLLLMDARVTYRGSQHDKVMLTNISNVPQTIKTKVHDYLVDITYYKKDHNLIFISQSKDKQFGGVAQSVIYQENIRIFSKSRSNEGLNKKINKQIEVFPNIDDTDVTVNLFFYSVYEEGQKAIVLN